MLTVSEFEALKRRTGQWIREYDPQWTAAYVREKRPEDVVRLLSESALLMEQTFVFEDTWDMEPCSVPFKLEPMAWDRSPNGDPEWVYMLNRHESLYKLLFSYYCTGEMEYICKLKWYLRDWIRQNPITLKGTESTRTIDTGIRIMAWQNLLVHLSGNELITREETEEILESIKEQLLNLRRRYIDKYTLSNWGLLQTTAICAVYHWFGELLPQEGIQEWAETELKTQLELQVLEDGGHWEKSVMYHVEVLLAVMKLLLAGYREEAPGEMLTAVTDRMSRYFLHLSGPDHCQPPQGDSDLTDIRDIMVKAAVCTGEPAYRAAGYEAPDLESIWLLGKTGIRFYEELKGAWPEELVMNGADSGVICIRNSWREDGDHTFLTCGSLGSSHGHCDLTHISLYHKGRPFFTDSGRYSYREEEPLRPMLKSACAHNVCVIDGSSQWGPKGSWGYEGYPRPIKPYFRSTEGIHYGEMSYYESLPCGGNALVLRQVMVLDPGIWLIANEIRCDGDHEVKEYYHLDQAVKVKAEERNFEKLPRGRKGFSCDLESEGVVLHMVSSDVFSCEKMPASSRYNQVADRNCLTSSAAFRDVFRSWTCLCGQGIAVEEEKVYQCGSDVPADPEAVTALRFRALSGEEWTLLLWHQETYKGGKMYLYRGRPVYAKAAVFHEKDGNMALYRLKN